MRPGRTQAMIVKSIRWRFQGWLAFLLVCILSGFGVTAYQLYRINLFSRMDDELGRRVAAINGDLLPKPDMHPPFGPPMDRSRFGRGPSGPGQPGHEPFDRGAFDHRPFDESRGAPPPDHDPDFPPGWGMQRLDFFARTLSPVTLNLFDQDDPRGFYFALWSPNDALIRRSTNAPADLPAPVRVGQGTSLHAQMRDSRRELFHFTELGDCFLVGRDIASDLRALNRFAGLLVLAGAGILALGLSGGWWLAGSVVQPVKAISAAANRISAGQLSERINVADTDSELGQLASVLNSTFARLEAAFAQQKQFTADASHELRTPITVIISEAQTILARERTATEYREAVEACLAAAQRMRRLAQSLLELSRYDAGEETLVRQSLDLAERARANVDLLRPLAREHGVEVQCDPTPAPAQGDAGRLDQVITNLLNNAIQHTPAHGVIRVSTRSEAATAILTIADTGRGIAAEDLPHVFERFYRADKSRAKAEGRTGLGLAICKAIIDAHGGSIEVASQPGQGTTFTVRLPQ